MSATTHALTFAVEGGGQIRACDFDTQDPVALVENRAGNANSLPSSSTTQIAPDGLGGEKCRRVHRPTWRPGPPRSVDPPRASYLLDVEPNETSLAAEQSIVNLRYDGLRHPFFGGTARQHRPDLPGDGR